MQLDWVKAMRIFYQADEDGPAEVGLHIARVMREQGKESGDLPPECKLEQVRHVLRMHI